MSTKSKLDPNGKTAKQRRATAAAAVRSGAANMPHRKDRIALMALANDLDAVRKDPKLTGAQKDARFKALMARAG